MQDDFISDLTELLEAVQKQYPETRESRKSLNKFKKVLTYQAGLRGKYLLAFTVLETTLENLITAHFCEDFDYQNMLSSWVLKPVPFSRKVIIMNNVLDCYRLDSIKKARKGWLPDLEKINRFRNNVAHLRPAYQEGKHPLSFHLITHKGAKREVTEITRADFERNLRQVEKANAVIFTLTILMMKEKELDKIAASNTAPAP